MIPDTTTWPYRDLVKRVTAEPARVIFEFTLPTDAPPEREYFASTDARYRSRLATWAKRHSLPQP